MTQETTAVARSARRFDYSAHGVSVDVGNRLESIAADVRRAARRSIAGHFEIARWLAEAFEAFGGGRGFDTWAVEYVGLSRTATRQYVQVYLRLRSNLDLDSFITELPASISWTDVIELASPKTPDELIGAVVDGDVELSARSIRAARGSQSTGGHASGPAESERLEAELAQLRRERAMLGSPAGLQAALAALPAEQAEAVIRSAAQQLLARTTAPATLPTIGSSARDFIGGLFRSPEWRKAQRIRRTVAGLAEALPRTLGALGVQDANEIVAACRAHMDATERAQAADALARTGWLLNAVAVGL